MDYRAFARALIVSFLLAGGFAALGRNLGQTNPTAQAPQVARTTMDVMTSVSHSVSPALRDLPVVAQGNQEVEDHAPLPLPPFRSMAQDNLVPAPDFARQAAHPQPLVFASQILNFDGLAVNSAGEGRLAPPDTNGAVGLTQFVQIVNLSYAVYDKSSGDLIAGPSMNKALWSGFGGDCENRNDGDPIVLYDRMADRWFITQFTIGPFRTGVGSFLQCMAVSTSGDAAGTYNLYAFDFGNDDFIDYGKFGTWSDAYYGNFNTFNRTGSFFKYGKECAFDRAAMINGDPSARAVCFNTPADAGFLASDLDGFNPPPDGAPNPFVEIWGVGPNSSLAIWPFHVDFDTPDNSTFGPPTILQVDGFTPAPFSSVVPQGETTQKLDALGDRMMFRLAYRNFLDHESLVVNHAVGDASQVSVRWYEIQDPNGTPFVFQEGTFAPDSSFRWMGSIAMDQMGNIAMGYSVSDAASHPSIFFTGRLSTDDPGLMEDEAGIFGGDGSQTNFLSRWGDYSSITIDPADDCTFWYTTEYIPQNGTFNWQTRIVNFVFPNCPPTP
jgi:hypothetical protein